MPSGRVPLNITGHRYGRLVVLEMVRIQRRRGAFWLCRCDCGRYLEANTNAMRTGNTRSCGCLHIETCIARSTTHGDAPREDRQRLYRIWRAMYQRCNNPNAHNFKYYGGRGIAICSEWADYPIFRAWALRTGYQKHLTIEREDNDGDYRPSNCRWATMCEQNQNKRNSIARAA